VRARRSPPTLRLYRWAAPTLTIGYAQDRGRDVDLAACRARGVEVVRRATGGRAVLHDAELTYSVAVPAGEPGFGTGLDESLRAVAAGLLAALRLLGVDAAVPAGSHRGAARRLRHPGCFAAPARHEIVVGGRKLVGSAQRRRDGAFLQHGSILIAGHGEPLGELLRAGAAAGATGLRMVGLAELLDPCPPSPRLAAALAAGCAAAWGCAFTAAGPDPQEVRAARELERSRYRSEAWNAGRRPLAEAALAGGPPAGSPR
jgi:lipoate-protein ligase A